MRAGSQHHAPADLPSTKRPGTNFTEVWVGPRAGLNAYEEEKSIDSAVVSTPKFSLRN